MSQKTSAINDWPPEDWLLRILANQKTGASKDWPQGDWPLGILANQKTSQSEDWQIISGAAHGQLSLFFPPLNLEHVGS